MSRAELARRYRRELREASAKPRGADPVLPPRKTDMRCSGPCRQVTGIVRGDPRGEMVRLCDECEAASK